MILTEKQMIELQSLFPAECSGLIDYDYDELINFLDAETVLAFENDEPTTRSSQIEKLMDSIIWDQTHGIEGVAVI